MERCADDALPQAHAISESKTGGTGHQSLSKGKAGVRRRVRASCDDGLVRDTRPHHRSSTIVASTIHRELHGNISLRIMYL